LPLILRLLVVMLPADIHADFSLRSSVR